MFTYRLRRKLVEMEEEENEKKIKHIEKRKEILALVAQENLGSESVHVHVKTVMSSNASMPRQEDFDKLIDIVIMMRERSQKMESEVSNLKKEMHSMKEHCEELKSTIETLSSKIDTNLIPKPSYEICGERLKEEFVEECIFMKTRPGFLKLIEHVLEKKFGDLSIFKTWNIETRGQFTLSDMPQDQQDVVKKACGDFTRYRLKWNPNSEPEDKIRKNVLSGWRTAKNKEKKTTVAMPNSELLRESHNQQLAQCRNHVRVTSNLPVTVERGSGLSRPQSMACSSTLRQELTSTTQTMITSQQELRANYRGGKRLSATLPNNDLMSLEDNNIAPAFNEDVSYDNELVNDFDGLGSLAQPVPKKCRLDMLYDDLFLKTNTITNSCNNQDFNLRENSKFKEQFIPYPHRINKY